LHEKWEVDVMMLRKSRFPDSTDPGRPFQAGLAAGRRASCERRQQRKLRSHRAKPIPTLRWKNNFREEGNRRGRWGEPQIRRQSSHGSAYVKREGRRSRRVSEPKSKPFKVNLFMLVCVFMCVRACVEINRGDECDLRNGGAFFSQLALSLFFYSPTLSRHHCGRRRRRRRRSITVAPHFLQKLRASGLVSECPAGVYNAHSGSGPCHAIAL